MLSETMACLEQNHFTSVYICIYIVIQRHSYEACSAERPGPCKCFTKFNILLNVEERQQISTLLSKPAVLTYTCLYQHYKPINNTDTQGLELVCSYLILQFQNKELSNAFMQKLQLDLLSNKQHYCWNHQKPTCDNLNGSFSFCFIFLSDHHNNVYLFWY